MRARRTRRLSFFLLPLNITPAMTSMVPGRARLYIGLGPDGERCRSFGTPTIAVGGDPVKRGRPLLRFRIASAYSAARRCDPAPGGGTADDQAGAGERAGGADLRLRGPPRRT